MKTIIYFSVLFILFSCKHEKANDIGAANSKDDSVGKEIMMGKGKINSAAKWIQYKRIPAGIMIDEKPYPGCYFTVKGNKFFYYKSFKLVYADNFKSDKYLNRTLFENHDLDEIIFSKKDSTEAVLKRDNYEGEYEYFKKER